MASGRSKWHPHQRPSSPPLTWSPLGRGSEGRAALPRASALHPDSSPQWPIYCLAPFILNSQGHALSSLFERSSKITNTMVLKQKQNHKDSPLLPLIHLISHSFNKYLSSMDYESGTTPILSIRYHQSVVYTHDRILFGHKKELRLRHTQRHTWTLKALRSVKSASHRRKNIA